MEKVLQPYDKERMRMAMLKHEEVFKQQVCELHRLYRTQKMLMVSAGLSQQQPQQQQQQQQIRQLQERYLVESKKAAFTINGQQQQQQQQQALQGYIDCKSNNSNLMRLLKPQRPDHEHHQVGVRSDAQEHIAESNNNMVAAAVELDDESEIELTLSLGPASLVQNPKGRPRTRKSESGQSLSSSSTGSSQTRKTSPKNSSAPIITKGDQHHQFTWGNGTAFTHQGSEPEPGFSNGQQTNPPWLFQTLSLKLT